MRIAIVCLEFARVQRVRNLAEGLVKASHEVVFFTSEQNAEHEAFDVVTIPFTRAATTLRSAVGIAPGTNMSKAARARGRATARLVSRLARGFEALTQFPDKYSPWIPAARQWLHEHPSALDGFDLVIASSPPATTLYVGRIFAQQAYAPLIFDFRDLWTDNPSYPFGRVRKAKDRVAERRLVEASEGATAATKSFADGLTRRYPSLPVRAVYTGIDPTPWAGLAPRAPDGRLVFGHFGVWYAHRRSITPLLESLRRLADAGVIDLEMVSVQLWGDGADEETWDATRRLGMDSVVTDCGWLEPDAVPAHLARVDVALLLAWPEDTTSVPLKTHGYIASGKPVLVLGASPDSEMAAFLAGVVGVVIAESPEAIDEAVSSYWNAARTRAPLGWSLQERPLPVSQETMASGFLGLIDVDGDARATMDAVSLKASNSEESAQ